MSKRRKPQARAEPQKRSAAWLCSPDAFETLACKGYTSLAHNPEISAGVDTIARLVGSMTIQLMQNRADGDVRIRPQDDDPLGWLARKIDIDPNRYTTREQFIHWKPEGS